MDAGSVLSAPITSHMTPTVSHADTMPVMPINLAGILAAQAQSFIHMSLSDSNLSSLDTHHDDATSGGEQQQPARPRSKSTRSRQTTMVIHQTQQHNYSASSQHGATAAAVAQNAISVGSRKERGTTDSPNLIQVLPKRQTEDQMKQINQDGGEADEEGGDGVLDCTCRNSQGQLVRVTRSASP